MNRHPSFDITGTISDRLKGKKIILCITGSVGAVKSPEAARLLMRHGAEVIPVMTKAACGLVTPEMMHWSTGNIPVTEITGAVEHVEHAGNTPTKADLILIYPATANTVGKIACGIDDTPVTTFSTTAIGEQIPVILVPAMHYPMYNHPAVKKNLQTLESFGIDVMNPVIEEGKAKIPSPESICDKILDTLSSSEKNLPLKGAKVLITAGRTVEYLDPIRVVTNNSSGKMGKALAEEALKLGAEVTVLYGFGTVVMPAQAQIIHCETSEKLFTEAQQQINENNYDFIICAAAVGDWIPVNQSEKKISTHTNEEISISFRPAPKILDMIGKNKGDAFLIAFRAQHNLSRKELLEDAEARMKKAGADMIAANDTSIAGAGFMTDTNKMSFITLDGEIKETELVSKNTAAALLLKTAAEKKSANKI